MIRDESGREGKWEGSNVSMGYSEYVKHVQTIVSEYMPNEQVLTKEKADELAERLLKMETVNPGEPKKGYHQTVVVYREQGTWVPVTVHWKTDENGRVQYVRMHSSMFVREYGQES
jgi:hypothetical protein